MSLYIPDRNRSFTIPYYDDDFLIKKIHDEGKLISMEEYIMGEENSSYYRFSDPRHIKHYEFVNKYETYKKEQLVKEKEVKETVFDDIADQLHHEDSNLIQLGNYIGEPTPTQFQEAHKKWRRILDEKNKEINALQKQIMDLNCSYDVVEARLLKYKLDELQLANQEKDIEIQELRDQVTQQAQRWLVPNFK